MALIVVFYFEKLPERHDGPILKFRDKIISVEVSDSEYERIAGLSGRQFLSADRGMFFVFDKSGKHGIWMKDMKFPIDILWLDEEYAVVDIAKNITPDTYPIIFTSRLPALYVLEVNAGTADDYNIDIGDEFIYEEKY